MKKTVTLALSLLTVVTMYAQTFEGRIMYKNTYKSKTPEMKNEQWTAMMGATMEYLIKGGDYKSTLNGTMVQWQLYNNGENKLFTKMANSETLLWNDAAVQGDEVLKVQVNKGVAQVLGYKCDEVILTCKSGVQKYYFNSKFGVDAKLFAKHKYGNWYDYLVKANAIPLKSIIETPQFIMESVATEITAMKLDAKQFQIATGTKMEKSPY